MSKFPFAKPWCSFADQVATLESRGMVVNAWSAPRLPSNMQIFATMLILNQMLRRAPAAEPLRLQWRQRMEAHLATPPSCADPLGRMGLPANWASHPLWK